MPTLVDVATLRLHVQTDLDNTAVQRLLDDADELIVDRYGPHTGPLTVELDVSGNLAFPLRRIAAVTSITEYSDRGDAVGVLLNALDYRLLNNGTVIERLATGPNAASGWGERLVIVHTAGATARRTRVEIDLVRLAVTYEARRSERVGDFGSEHVEYERERNRILRSLGTPVGIH